MTRVLGRIREWLAGPGHRATIDTAKAAPPPSPLAPVELTSTAEVAGIMEIAARIGDILLSSGTSNTDTKAQIRAVTSAYGHFGRAPDDDLGTFTWERTDLVPALRSAFNR